jgi:copper transport protein
MAVPGFLSGPPLAWNEVLGEYLQFAGYFLAIGAVAYRYLVLPKLSPEANAQPLTGRETAATIGMIGALLLLLSAMGSVEMKAILQHQSFTDSLPKNVGRFQVKSGTLALTLIGFTLARRASTRLGWPVAAVGILLTVLQPLAAGRLGGAANAVHVLAASTWLGTLTVMLFAAIRALARGPARDASRQRITADLVNTFSPVALTAAVVLALTGVTTAWIHLKRISSLWETNYGRMFILKLCLVAGVVALGAWNWKRMKPALGVEGNEEAVARIERSATAEVVMGAIVLLATAILVSLPSPK